MGYDYDLVTGIGMFEVKAGGADRNRGGAENLRHYWTRGEGAAKIRWNEPGDFTRCFRHLSKYMGERAKGWCALRHREMDGMWPGDKRNKSIVGDDVSTVELLGPDILDSHGDVIPLGGTLGLLIKAAPHLTPAMVNAQAPQGDWIGAGDEFAVVGWDGRAYTGSVVVLAEPAMSEAKVVPLECGTAFLEPVGGSVVSVGDLDPAGEAKAARFGTELTREGRSRLTAAAAHPGRAGAAARATLSRYGESHPAAQYAADRLTDGHHVTIIGHHLPAVLDALKNESAQDLGRLHVSGDDHFGSGGLGLSRDEMPQIPGDRKPDFYGELAAEGIEVRQETVDPRTLKPVQTGMVSDKVAGMLDAMRNGTMRSDSRLIASSDGYILDGHHRWAASVARAYEDLTTIPIDRVGLPISALLARAESFNQRAGIERRTMAGAKTLELLASIDAKARFGDRLRPDTQARLMALASGDGPRAAQARRVLSRYGISAPAAVDPVRSNDPQVKAHAIAKAAAAVEPELTQRISSVVEGLGGRMDGLAHRLKTEESIARKLVSKAKAKGVNVSDVRIGDAVRYTAVVEPDNYAAAVSGVIAGMQDAGFELSEVTDTFQPGNVYRAVHLGVRTGDGIETELQFHTPDSLALKGENHLDYEVARDPVNPLPDRRAAYDRMLARYANVNRPHGLTLPSGTERLTYVFDPEHGILANRTYE